MLSKKGVTPVVGFVLLLGFSIAIGASIFLMTSKHTTEIISSSTEYLEGGLHCEDVKIDVMVQDPDACALSVSNVRFQNIEQLRIFKSDYDVISYIYKDKILQPRTENRPSAEYTAILNTSYCGSISVTPIIKIDDKFATCRDKTITVDCTACVGLSCGNNTIEPGETCDGADLDGEDCISQGFGGGVLACAADCLSFDTSGCVGAAAGREEIFFIGFEDAGEVNNWSKDFYENIWGEVLYRSGANNCNPIEGSSMLAGSGRPTNGSHKEMPNYNDNSGIVNMEGNVLLMHLNQDPAYGENPSFFYDFSGNGNNGYCVADCPVFNSSGKYGGTYEFLGDAVQNFINISNSPSLMITGEITLMAWVKPHSYLTDKRIVQKRQGINENSYGLFIDSGGVEFRASNCAPSSYQGVSDSSVIPLETWSHVAATFVDATDTVKIYFNGINTNTSTSFTRTLCGINEEAVQIGGVEDRAIRWFNGFIDEVAIFNRSLSDVEISDIYNTSFYSTLVRYNRTLPIDVTNHNTIEIDYSMASEEAESADDLEFYYYTGSSWQLCNASVNRDSGGCAGWENFTCSINLDGGVTDLYIGAAWKTSSHSMSENVFWDNINITGIPN